MNRWYVWASNEYGHGGNMSRDVKDLMGMNSDRKWVRYEYREMVSGYEINGTGGGMNLMRRPEKDHRGCVHGLYVHGRI